jgi:hypothetical protein
MHQDIKDVCVCAGGGHAAILDRAQRHFDNSVEKVIFNIAKIAPTAFPEA